MVLDKFSPRMERLTAKTSLYEIDRCLGQGLTSEVYKANRCDSEGFTRQEVALKILKSRNDVQILQKEFSQLVRIRSQHCVRVLSWENFPQGAALVLEYIDGVTMANLLKHESVSRFEKMTVLAQVRLGLTSLHDNGVFHGDLNLHNIMVNRYGVVKIIDFGFGQAGEQCLTPEFASSRRRAGELPTSGCDWYSFSQIAKFLLGGATDMGELKALTPRSEAQIRLGQRVSVLLDRPALQTQKQTTRRSRSVYLRALYQGFCGLCFVIVLLRPEGDLTPPKQYALKLRSQSWFEYSINGSPFQWGPVDSVWLRRGHYQLHLRRSAGLESHSVPLLASQTFLLNPDGNNL
jgi:serine/threonine protein kinase